LIQKEVSQVESLLGREGNSKGVMPNFASILFDSGINSMSLDPVDLPLLDEARESAPGGRLEQKKCAAIVPYNAYMAYREPRNSKRRKVDDVGLKEGTAERKEITRFCG
jgi:hypothetical protein